MNDKLLYFPFINIPDNSWTIKGLLYWDSVGIIVPQQFRKHPEHYDNFTKELLRTDLIEEVVPYEHLTRIRNFHQGFNKLIEKSTINIDTLRAAFLARKTSSVHIQKFGDILLKQLADLGIAGQIDHDWYEVESSIARKIMFYLAITIGAAGNFTPGTDKFNPLSVSNASGLIGRGRIRNRLLENLMPYPVNPDLTMLKRFKDKYHAELTSFRILLEQAALDISMIRSKEDRNEMLEFKIEEIKDAKEKIQRELEFSFSKIGLGTLCGIGAAFYGLSQDNKPLALFGFANTIYSALKELDQSQVKARDYSYLALVDKKLLK